MYKFFTVVYLIVSSLCSAGSASAQTSIGEATLTTDWAVNSKFPAPRKEEVKVLTLGGDGNWKILFSFNLAPAVSSKLKNGSFGVLEMDVSSLSLQMSADDGDFSNVSLVAYPMLQEEWRGWSLQQWRILAHGTDYDDNEPIFSAPVNVPEILNTKRIRFSFLIKDVKAFEQAGLKGIILTMSGEKASTMIRQIDVAGSANVERRPLTLSFFDTQPAK